MNSIDAWFKLTFNSPHTDTKIIQISSLNIQKHSSIFQFLIFTVMSYLKKFYVFLLRKIEFKRLKSSEVPRMVEKIWPKNRAIHIWSNILISRNSVGWIAVGRISISRILNGRALTTRRSRHPLNPFRIRSFLFGLLFFYLYLTILCIFRPLRNSATSVIRPLGARSIGIRTLSLLPKSS